MADAHGRLNRRGLPDNATWWTLGRILRVKPTQHMIVASCPRQRVKTPLQSQGISSLVYDTRLCDHGLIPLAEF